MAKIPQIKRNRAYWDSRKQVEQAYIKQKLAEDEQFNRELQKRFDRVQAEMQKNIELELYRLSEKNEIDISKVRGIVSQADIKEMEAYAKQVVEKARKLHKELGRPLSQDDFTKEVNDRMRLYNATMRINRLELIKSKIGMQTVDLGLDINADIKKKLNQDYQDQIKRQAGIMGDDVPNLTDNELKDAVKSVIATTGGVTFSKRVWSDMDGLKAELDVQLVNSLVQGQSVAVIAKKLRPFVSDKFNNKRYAAERIARTESARVDTDATLASLKKYGYKFCQWHDEYKACDSCVAIAQANPTGYGQGVYEIDDVPYLPNHPNCRCSISAYWVDDDLVNKEITSEIPSNLFDKNIYSNQISDDENVFYNTWNKQKIKMKQRRAIDNEWYNNLSEDEQNSVKNYTTESYKSINMLSRDPHALDGRKRDEVVKRYIKVGDNLEKALSKAKYHENMVTYRNVGAKEFESLKSQVGDEIHYTTEFKSTTTNQIKPIEKSYSGEQVVRYFIQKGSQAQYIADYSAYYEEQEVLINRKRPYIVKENDGNLEVYTW